MPEKIAILGAGQIGRQVMAHIRSASSHEIVGFFDDGQPAGTSIGDVKVLGPGAEIFDQYNKGRFQKLLIAVGYADMKAREEVFSRYSGKLPLASFIHPFSFVDPGVQLGENVIIYPGTVIDVHCSIGSNVLLNCGCVISHDSKLEDNIVFGPRVTLSGFCTVGKGSFIGTGTIMKDSISLGRHTRIGAGSLIIKDVPDHAFGYGAPFQQKN